MSNQWGWHATALAMLFAAGALSGVFVSDAASASGLGSAASDQAGGRQSGAGMAPRPSGGPSGPMDVGLAEVGFRDLPVSVEAGQAFAVHVRAPGGAACSGRIAYQNGQWQSLDEAGLRVGPCDWEVSVPVGTRPGSLTLAAEIGRSGQGSSILGVVYVTNWTVGVVDDGARTPSDAS